MKSIPIDELRMMFSYDPDTGLLSWNRDYGIYIRAGDKAGCVKVDGYGYVAYKRDRFMSHRICWALHYGCWPNGPIDHINMVKSDNRISNLRLASVAENNRNRTKQRNNTTGFKGVSFYKQTKKYVAKICFNKKTRTLGYFDTAIEASIAYSNAVKELHGEYARV